MFQQKICWKAVGRNLAFSLVPKGVFLSAPASIISAKENAYILAFLCSSVGKYYFYQNSDTTGAGDIMLNIQSLVKFPIPNFKEKYDDYEILVKKILINKQQNKDTQLIENQINTNIYKLYEFSDEEIEYIENS